jgi:hypothetical protein
LRPFPFRTITTMLRLAVRTKLLSVCLSVWPGWLAGCYWESSRMAGNSIGLLNDLTNSYNNAVYTLTQRQISGMLYAKQKLGCELGYLTNC